MTIQRCAHLKPDDDVAALYVTMGIAMELCAECRAEMDHRLSEKPLSGQTPIEKAAAKQTGEGIRCRVKSVSNR
jgi:hypothetical protein